MAPWRTPQPSSSPGSRERLREACRVNARFVLDERDDVLRALEDGDRVRLR